MRSEPKHDKISITPINAVRCEWVIIRRGSPLSDVAQQLVLALSRYVTPREDDIEVLPSFVLLKLPSNKILHLFVELVHELGAWTN